MPDDLPGRAIGFSPWTPYQAPVERYHKGGGRDPEPVVRPVRITNHVSGPGRPQGA